MSPSFLTLSSTCRTRSGRSFALPISDLPAKSIVIFSVPALISEATFRTVTPPDLLDGSGTSAPSSSPERTCWRTCFTDDRTRKCKRIRGLGTTARGDRAAPAATERRSIVFRSDRAQLAGRDIGNHEPELPRPGSFEALPVLDPDLGVVPDALACLFEKAPLIHLRIPGAA